MNQIELQTILDQHKIWLEDRSKGKRADFSDADLRGADLRWANLQGADLRRADLRRADLSKADLREADLKGADLTKIKDYETTSIWQWIIKNYHYKLIPAKELVIKQKMIENNDKSTAILYKNTWMAEECKKILKGETK